MEGLVTIIIQSAIGGVVAGSVFVATVKTELKYMRRDIDWTHKWISTHEDKHHG